ncbi:MAG: MFS transporter [Candidatus Methanomethylophilaceae archaeon]
MDVSEDSGRRYILIYIVIALAMFLDGLDGTIVNVALPSIAGSFGIGTSASSWVSTVYFLVMAGLILVFGKICDKGAVRKVMVAGLLIFSISSLACGLSGVLSELIVFRAVQGIGASMIASSCMLATVSFLPPRKITFGLSVSLLGWSLGAAAGPALGGILTEMLSWHWIFFINVPIGIIAAVVCMRAFPKDRGLDRTGFDIGGSAMLFVCIVTGLFALETVPSHGLSVVNEVAIIVCIVFLALFIRHSLRSASPVLDLRLFKVRSLVYVVIALLLMNVCYMGAQYLFPFFLTIEMGYSAVESSIHMLIPAIAILALCLFTGKMAETRGNRIFCIAGCIILTVFSIISCFIGSGTPLLVIVALLLLGLTWGICGGPIGSRVIDYVPDGKQGEGSSLMTFIIYLGSAMGTAMFSGLFSIGSGSAGTSIPDLEPAVFMDGFLFSMVSCVVMCVIITFLSWYVRENGRDI